MDKTIKTPIIHRCIKNVIAELTEKDNVFYFRLSCMVCQNYFMTIEVNEE